MAVYVGRPGSQGRHNLEPGTWNLEPRTVMTHTLSFVLLVTAAFAQTPAPAAPAPPRLSAVRLSTGPAWDAAKGPNDQTGISAHSLNIARLRGHGTLVFGGRFGELGLLVLRVPDEAAVRKARARSDGH
ncbi:MAG: hypothetical protein ABIP90_03875 [Vicinamibacterales bacterium]